MSDAITALGSANAPNFFALAAQGASTLNARTDPTHTNTLPNHASQFTSRPVDGASGHAWDNNNSCGSSAFATIHAAKGSYVQSVFDVVHDNSFSTALYARKTKFCIFNDSWDGTNGAADTTGVDNGTDKIGTYSLSTSSSATLAANFVSDMTTSNFNYAVLHLSDPDSSGHGSNWDLTAASDYLNAVEAVDDILGDLLTLVSTDPDLSGKTAIILTSDHGGELGTGSHSTTLSDLKNHEIPFYVWGPGVSAGSDLYTLNTTTRTDPVATIPDMTTGGPSAQPIRNGDAANLALQLLELPAISGSVINSAQDLNVAGAP